MTRAAFVDPRGVLDVGIDSQGTSHGIDLAIGRSA
jgi:hypothetical protein